MSAWRFCLDHISNFSLYLYDMAYYLSDWPGMGGGRELLKFQKPWWVEMMSWEGEGM